jgi:hypothetical protein
MRDRDFAIEATKWFLAPPALDSLVPEISSTRDALALSEVRDLAAAFFENISAVLQTVGIPVTLASSAAHGSHWQRIHSAERIRSLKLSAFETEDDLALRGRRDTLAHEVASRRMSEFVESNEGRDSIAADACRFLISSLESSELKAAATELLLQGEVLAWCSLEGLARDLLEFILNREPKRIAALMADSTARQRIPARITLEEMANFNFNLTSCLGTLVVAQQDLSDIKSIRTLIPALLGGDGSVAVSLGERSLWNLCQRRHLIVHRRGVVDAKYLEAVGGSDALGRKIVVNPDELERDIRAVASAGITMLIRAAVICTQPFDATDA